MQRLRSLTPATVVAPESYDDQPTDDRTEPEVQLRTWSDRSVGVTRYPVGLVRFVVPCEEERSGWSLGHRVVTFYRDGTAVVRASWTRSAGAPEDVAGLVRDLGTRQVSSDRATLLVAELDDPWLDADPVAVEVGDDVELLDVEAHLVEALDALADANGDDFDAFREAWSHPRMHAVFTAHPTFLLTPAQSAAVAQGALSGETPPSDKSAEAPERKKITQRARDKRPPRWPIFQLAAKL